MSKAILYDATMCIGCKQCEGACAQQNKLPYNDAVAAESIQSAHKYTVVMSKDDKFMRRLCMHCEKPACASVCPLAPSIRQSKARSSTTSGSASAAAIAWWLACLPNPSTNGSR